MNSIWHLYDNETVTFSQLLVKAHRNEEEDTTSKVVNKNVIVNDDSTLEQRVDRLIAKSNIIQNLPSTSNRDNSQNYGRPPFQSGQRSRGDYLNNPSQMHPQGGIRQNLRGLKASAAGPFGEADGSRPI